MESPPSYPDGNVNNGHKILIVSWVECGVALLFVTLRIFTRVRLIRAFGWDDAMILVAMALSLTTTVLNTVMVHYGVGRHFAFLNPLQMQMSEKYIYLTQIPSTFSSCFGKIAVALLLRRIMAPNRVRSIFLWFIIASLLIMNIVVNVVVLAYCKPLAFLWDRSIKGSCLPTPVLRDTGYLQGAWTIFGDVSLALFPVFILYNLQVKLRLKLGLICVMSLGIFAAIAAALKTAELKKIAASQDQTYVGNKLIYYYSTENNLVIIAACIPTLKPLIVNTSRLYTVYTGRGSAADPGASGRLMRPQRRSYKKHANQAADSELAVFESHENRPLSNCSTHTMEDPKHLARESIAAVAV